METEVLVFKANEERREITAPVLLPGVVDLHGDIYSEEEVMKACRNFNEFCKKSNLQHQKQMNDSDIKFIESYVTPADMTVKGFKYPKGTWMSTAKINSDVIWKSVKDGYFTGFSIGCRVKSEKVDE